jgi:shikimate kinase/3-dehydroquinate synthase
MKPAIVFIGFMGAGKSSAARSMEDRLEFVDMDDHIKRHVGMPVTTYFEKHGEDAFREEEARLAVRLLEESDGGVIALGGGTVLSERVREALKAHTVVWLQVDAETAWARVERSDRPLAQDRSAFEALFEARLQIYESLADVVIPQGDLSAVRRALPAIQALGQLPDRTKLLWASSTSGEYPIFVGHGLLNRDWWPLKGRQYLIADTSTLELVWDELDSFVGVDATIHGEATKTIDQAARILEDMAQAGMTREDHVVALGGGVVGDIAGFCAAVYQRGVRVVQVPTTLVAQVDSAYGGKTGVDLPQGKNYVGAFHQPSAVVVDTSTLSSLPREELSAGFVEALKTGLLAGGSLWERVREMDAIDIDGIDDVIFACAHYKCAIVAADEFDLGLRNVLNLGHTVGHAIETVTDYSRFRHGEAVGLGLLAALRLSDAPALREEVEGMLLWHDLPVQLSLGGRDPETWTNEILRVLQRDKKRTAAGVGFVLLSEPGQPRVGQLVDPARVRDAVEELFA